MAMVNLKVTVVQAEAVDLAYEVRSKMGELKSQTNPSHFTVGVKSQNGFGSVSQMGSYIKSKDEIFLGLRSKEGWGFLVSDSYAYSQHPHRSHDGDGSTSPTNNHENSPRKLDKKVKLDSNSQNNNQSVDEALSLDPTDRTGMGDIGTQFFHPIFSDDIQNYSGMLRVSLPTSGRSQDLNSFNYGYNIIHSYRLPKEWNLSTVLSISYFSRNSYAPPTDTLFGSGLINSLNRRMNSWLRLGGGQRTSVSTHIGRATGKSVEVFTTADFLLTPSIFMGPRVHFPIYAQGAAYSDVPTNPAIQSISADFFMQISL